jgi:hypothetical protein
MSFIENPLYTLHEDVLDTSTISPEALSRANADTGRFITILETTLQISRMLPVKGVTGVGQLSAEIADKIVDETREFSFIPLFRLKTKDKLFLAWKLPRTTHLF